MLHQILCFAPLLSAKFTDIRPIYAILIARFLLCRLVMALNYMLVDKFRVFNISQKQVIREGISSDLPRSFLSFFSFDAFLSVVSIHMRATSHHALIHALPDSLPLLLQVTRTVLEYCYMLMCKYCYKSSFQICF